MSPTPSTDEVATARAAQAPGCAKDTVTKKRGRSNGGCGNCKKRKIKCDERKPTCARCDARHLKCPGYPVSTLKWSSKHEVFRTRTPGELPIPRSRLPADLPATLETTSQEPSRGLIFPPGWDLGQRATMGTHAQSVANTDSSDLSSLTGASPLSMPDIMPPSHTSQQHSAGREAAPMATLTNHAFVQRNESPNLMGDHYQHIAPNFTSHQYDGPDDRPEPSRRRPQQLDLETPPQNLELGLSTITAIPQSEQSETRLPSFSLPYSLLHVPTLLVDYYFQRVCRDCSTYDSPSNPFRTVVSELRLNSASLNYAIQSLAACKLADELPQMKIAGIEAQGLALESLKKDCSAVSGLHDVSEAVLCTILLLGMTTSWHVPSDIGLGYLALAQRIIKAKTRAAGLESGMNIEFHVNALKYWNMIISLVSGDVDCTDSSARHSSSSTTTSILTANTEKIMPHPWTGISPESQQLFGNILLLIRKIRATGNRAASTYSRAGITDISHAITTAEQLEAQCWSVSIPPVDDLSDTRDVHTPPLDHVLTAKAYLLCALLHVYMMFPDVLESRIQSDGMAGSAHAIARPDTSPADAAHIVSASTMWPERVPGDPHHMWLRDIGFQIVQCLEGISVYSSTRVVHAPLLLCVSSALTLLREGERTANDAPTERALRDSSVARPHNHARCTCDQASDIRVRQCRSFIVHRLEAMSGLMRFRAVDNVLTINKEVWRRADAGSQDTFWMDIMHELHCETLFG